MGRLDGKVAIVTGAGRGIGRGEALELARAGARVVVNDLGGAGDGTGADQAPAQQVADEIVAGGGEAVANYDSVADFAGAERLVGQAVETFGRLDVLVNNAGILRDGMSFNMPEEDFDAVVSVHLKGHFATAHFAGAHWRERSKAGEEVSGRIINTASESGLYGNLGQVNYAAAKAGIAAMTIVLGRELAKYGVTANAIAPRANTRLLQTVSEGEEAGENAFDPFDPENVAPVVAWLASDEAAHVSGQVFTVWGDSVRLVRGWTPVAEISNDRKRWTLDELTEASKKLFADADPGLPPFHM